MSALRGDSARHHRLRKKKIRNRAKMREIKKELGVTTAPAQESAPAAKK